MSPCRPPLPLSLVLMKINYVVCLNFSTYIVIKLERNIYLKCSKITESRIEFKTFDSNTMLDHYLSKKFKLIEKGKFNYLINTLIIISNLICYQNRSL